MSNEITASTFDDYVNSLEHHGIMGQKWGVRNAEWYPIADFQAHLRNLEKNAGPKVKKAASVAKEGSKAAVKKSFDVTKTIANATKELLKKRKEKKALKKEEKKKLKEIKKEEKAIHKKEDVLSRGTPGDIVKFSPKLSNEELSYSKARQLLLKDLRGLEKERRNEIEQAEFQKKWGGIMNAAKVLTTVAGASESVSRAIKTIDGALKDAGFKDDTTKNKRSVSWEEVMANPRAFTDQQVKDAWERNKPFMEYKSKAETDWRSLLDGDEGASDAAVKAAAERLKNYKAILSYKEDIDKMQKKMKDVDLSGYETTTKLDDLLEGLSKSDLQDILNDNIKKYPAIPK